MTKKRPDAMVAAMTVMLLVWMAALSGTAAPGDPWTRKELGENDQPDPTTHSAAAFDEEREEVVLFIPEMAGTEGTGQKSETWVWNGAEWEEKVATLLEAAPEPSSYTPAMAYDAARKESVLFIAPKPADPGPDSDVPGETYTWNGQAWTKESPDDSPPANGRAAMAFDEVRQQIVLLTGVAVDPTAPVNDTWLWDGTNWEKAENPKGPSPARIDAAMAFDRRLRQVVLFGGSQTSVDGSVDEHTYGITENSLCDTWTWDGREWFKIETDRAPPPRSWHAMVADPGPVPAGSGTVDDLRGLVLFGGVHLGGTPRPSGQPASGVLFRNDTWAWRGGSWERGPSVGPSPRFGHGMAYDPQRQETVLFGGRSGMGSTNGPETNDTWTLGRGPSVNDDDYSQPEISITNASVYEGLEGDTNTMSFGVSATGLDCTPEPVTVPYSTQDHTAEHPDDYEQTTGTVIFTNGQSAATVKVKVNGDNEKEEDEQFYVDLGTPTGATIREGEARGTGTIIDSTEDPADDPGLVELPEVEIPPVEVPDIPDLPRMPEINPPSGGGGSQGSVPSPSNSGTLGPGGGGPGVGGGGPASQALSSSANPAGSGSPGAIPVASPPQPSLHVSSTQSAQAAGILLSPPPPFAPTFQHVPWTGGAQGQMSAALGSASSEPEDSRPQPAYEMTGLSPDHPQRSLLWLGLLALMTVMIARPARRSVWHCGSDGAPSEQYDPKPSPAWAGGR